MSTELEAQLSAYLDGELTPEEESRVRDALAASPELTRRLAELESVDVRLSALPAPVVPAGAKARLRARIEREAAQAPAKRVAPGGRAPRRRGPMLAVAAASVAAALLAWLVLPRGGEEAAQVAERPTAEVPAPEPANERQLVEAQIPEAAPSAELPDLLAPDDDAERLETELDPADVAIVEVLDWLAALEGLEGLEPDEGRG